MNGKKKTKTLKPIPVFRSDVDAERFVDRADLSDYDLSQGRMVRFEFDRKDAQVNLRMPGGLLESVKKRAKQRGIPYQRFIREALEKALQ
jgi:predicted DNA binding CopG/RHH family protein